MSDKESQTEEARGGDSLTEEAGETTAAGTVSGPENPQRVGADTMAKVAGTPGDMKKGDRK